MAKSEISTEASPKQYCLNVQKKKSLTQSSDKALASKIAVLKTRNTCRKQMVDHIEFSRLEQSDIGMSRCVFWQNYIIYVLR